MSGGRLRIAVIGCGDVAARHYVPALARSGVSIAALVDPRPGAPEELVERIDSWSPGARPFASVEALLGGVSVDAAINLTPAPQHGSVNLALLQAGLHVYSEKPLAATLKEADELIRVATDLGVRLLCAPGVAITPRFRWLSRLVESGRFGRLTLAVTHHADPGPAAWREYTGDPTVFYGPAVGPVIDHGIYRLHAMTHLMGPVRRVQAMGTISMPTRTVRGGPLAGRTIPVTGPDHVLINLEFVDGGLGQLLASFGTPETRAPWLELHFTTATMSFGGKSWEPDAPVSVYLDDDGPLGLEGWVDDLAVPSDEDGVVELGVQHFVRHLRGEVPAILTAEHARHVLDVILKAYASVDDGRAHHTETTFERMAPP